MIESLRQERLTKTFKVNNYLQCILNCSESFLCSLAIIDSSICSIYNQVQITDSNVIYSPAVNIYVKDGYNPINQYLIHYWQFNGNYMNEITKAYLFNGKNDSLVTDRFGRPSSSLYLNYGYVQAPNGIYIYGEFTIATWVKMYGLENARRFFSIPTSSGDTI